MKDIRLGIVGTGGMGNEHARQFGKMAGVRVASVYDVVPERAAAFALQHRADAAPTVEALLGDVDAVSVVTPDRFHAEISRQVLQARKHLLCEKPLTVTLDEARAVAADAAASGVVHMVNFSYRHSAAFQRARELVQTRALGALRHVHSHYLQSWLSARHWGVWDDSDAWLWRLSTVDGSRGVLGDLGCHILDLTTGASEDATALRCTLHTFPKITQGGEAVTTWRGRELDANDTALIEMQLAGGGLGLCHTTRWATGHVNHLRVEVHGTEGALMFDLDADPNALNLCLGDARHRPEWSTETLSPVPTIYERFVRAIRTGRADQPDVVRGAQVQAYLDACERSAGSGQWESVRPWLGG